jgi:hypothetical protein
MINSRLRSLERPIPAVDHVRKSEEDPRGTSVALTVAGASLYAQPDPHVADAAEQQS